LAGLSCYDAPELADFPLSESRKTGRDLLLEDNTLIFRTTQK
jgi:hypothetical protein